MNRRIDIHVEDKRTRYKEDLSNLGLERKYLGRKEGV
jgi:hypothetical protein